MTATAATSFRQRHFPQRQSPRCRARVSRPNLSGQPVFPDCEQRGSVELTVDATRAQACTIVLAREVGRIRQTRLRSQMFEPMVLASRMVGSSSPLARQPSPGQGQPGRSGCVGNKQRVPPNLTGHRHSHWPAPPALSPSRSTLKNSRIAQRREAWRRHSAYGATTPPDSARRSPATTTLSPMTPGSAL